MDFWSPIKEKNPNKPIEQGVIFIHGSFHCLFSPLSCYQKHLASESGYISSRFPAVRLSPSSFPGPVKDWDCNECPHKWQQAGKTHPGCRKLRAPRLSLGWCSMSSPPNTGSTAGTGRVSTPQVDAMAFLLGI